MRRSWITPLALLALAALAPAEPSRLARMVDSLRAKHGTGDGSLATSAADASTSTTSTGTPTYSEAADDAPDAGTGGGVAPVPVNRIHFEGGDRVTGTLAWLRDGAIGFSGFSTSEIQAAFDQVADLETAETYEVELADGSRVIAAFRRTGDPATLGFTTVTGQEEVAKDRVVGIETRAYAEAQRAELIEKGRVRLGKVWKGHLDAKYSESSGNTELRNIEFQAEAVRKTAVDRLRLNLYTNNASNGNVKTAQRSWGDVRLDLFLPKDFFYFVQGRLETDELQNIDLRTTIGAGIGKTWRGPHDFELDFGLGYSFVREAFNTGTDNSEGTLLLTLDVDRRLGRNLGFEMRNIAYPNLSDNEFRYTSQTNFKSKIASDLSFLVGFLQKYDSDPLPGIKKSDFTITTGLRKDF
jgi:putative salt-induced outer membrane protein YdiY